MAAAERAVFLGDWHVPYHDPTAVGLALDFVRWFRPTAVFILGDFVDCYAFSRFDKDPRRLLEAQDELDQGRAILARLAKAARGARLHYLDGNHEHRLPKYLCKHPELSSLKAVQLPSLLGLREMGYRHHGCHEHLTWSGLRVEHGDLVRRASGATAKAMLERRGVCGISGHTHRLGAYYRTDANGPKVWLENGCLCDTRPDYMIGEPDWQQGFTVAYAAPGRRRFVAEQIPIIDGRLCYAGRQWPQKGVA
jgi:predicted phosphodiesterase